MVVKHAPCPVEESLQGRSPIPWRSSTWSSPTTAVGPSIPTVEEKGRVAYEMLTLRAPRDGRVLIHGLSAAIPSSARVLVRARVAAARVALLRAAAGLWEDGEGRVVRPALDQVAFLPERPYAPPGTCATYCAGTKGAAIASDEDIRRVIAALTYVSMGDADTRGAHTP